MDDLKAFGVPVLILSGGEPLLRPDIFDISRRAKDMGFYVGLSTNGTLIDESNIDRIAGIGYDYVGISIDGLKATHDRFRRLEGAFDASMHAIRLCHQKGIKVGMRFTMTQDNAHELPALLKLMEDEGVDKFLPLAPQLRRPRQHQPQGRRHSQNHALGDGPLVRHLLGLHATRPAQGVCHRQQRRRRRVPAVLGAPELPTPRKTTCAPNSPSGAATPRA